MGHPTPEDFSRKTSADHSLTSVPGSKPQTATRMEQGLPPKSAHPFRSRSKSLAYGTLAWQLQMPRYSLGSYPLDGGFDGFSANMGGGTGTYVPFKPNSWEPTLEKAIKAIVSIKASHVRSFDSETSGAYSATGFIVDAKNGLILSNRHVVSPAPIVAQGVLTNYEEVDLMPIYRDPVHDFGFLKFDPTRVKFMDLIEIPLSPEKAKVGLDIRVVGNDAGEKLSILAGTLARLDRRAPDYGIGEYNDFNTFYLQAASGTSGGSSGSPVLDIEGHAVALNAGGASKASSSYYLPLDRVKRALKFLQKNSIVPRGTLQTEFEYLPYDDVRRLGLKSSIEAEIREKFPEETGMLTVRSVLSKGPADGILVPGDIVIRLNGNMITNFIHLFSVIDDAVGQKVTMTISRGRKLMDMELQVQDLHSITPNRFVEIGGGIVNELSYQLAKSYAQPVGGPYVATSGHMLASASAWRKSVIVSVNNIPTPNLDAFVEAIKTLPDGARVPLRFYNLSKAYKEKVMIMHVDRHWHKFRIAARDDCTGSWTFTDMAPPPAIHSYVPATASFPSLDPSLKLAEKLMPSFVAIDFHLPYLVDGMKSTQFYGVGLIISTDPPLICCDRDTVPISTGDIFITFANSIIIPGKLLYLHPMYNYSIITYDATLLGATPVKAAQLSSQDLSQGDEVTLVGVGNDHSPVMKKTTITSITNIGTKECSPPRWRAMNVEGIKIDDPLACQGGVLCDNNGAVQALWLNYSSQNDKGKDITEMSGLAVSLVQPVLEPFKRGEKPRIRGLDAEFWTMRIAAARTLGLSDEWVSRVESSKKSRHTLLYVLNILDATSPAARELRVGDVILEMCGEEVTGMRDLIKMSDKEKVDMIILRDNREMKVTVPTVEYSGIETTRVLGWQGALVQGPYKAVLEQVREVPTGVYVSCTLYGSPASVVLRPGVWITEVQGRPVHDLDSFLQAVKAHEAEMARRKRPSTLKQPLRKVSIDIIREEEENDIHDNDMIMVQSAEPQSIHPNVAEDDGDDDEEEGYIRLKTVSRTNVTKLVAMKMDTHYWDTWQLLRDENATCGWICENC